MRTWQGMRRDEAAAAEGATHLAVNCRFTLEGELMRRRGYAKLGAATTNGPVIAKFWHPVTGLWLLSWKTSGEVEATAL